MISTRRLAPAALALGIALPGVALPATAQSGEETVSVAVVPFEARVTDPRLDWIGRSFATSIVTALSRSRSFRIIEREFLDRIMDELELQASGLVDPTSAARTGQLLGAQLMVVGSAQEQDETLLVTARVVRVGNAEVLGSVTQRGPVADLFTVQRNVGRDLTGVLAPLGAILLEPGGPAELATDALEDLDELAGLAADVDFYGKDSNRRQRRGELLLGLRVATELTEDHPGLARAHYFRGLFALNADQPDVADAASATAMRLEPEVPEHVLLRANVLRESDREREALAWYEDLAASQPQDARPWYAIGRMRKDAWEDARAVVAFLNAVQGAPYVEAAEKNLRTLLAPVGADALVEEVATVDESAHAAAALYRAVWAGRGASETFASRVVRERPRLYLGHLMLGRAVVERDPEAAERSLREALRLRPEAAPVHRSLALLLLARGRCAEGRDHVELYLMTASFVDDYDRIQEAMDRCR